VRRSTRVALCVDTTSYTQLFATFRRLGFVSTQVAPVVARVKATTTTIHVRVTEVYRKTTWRMITALLKKGHRTKTPLLVAVDLRRTTSVTCRSRRVLPRLRRARLRPAEESVQQSPLAAVTALQKSAVAGQSRTTTQVWVERQRADRFCRGRALSAAPIPSA
jgi:hypothetical protein